MLTNSNFKASTNFEAGTKCKVENESWKQCMSKTYLKKKIKTHITKLKHDILSKQPMSEICGNLSPYGLLRVNGKFKDRCILFDNCVQRSCYILSSCPQLEINTLRGGQASANYVQSSPWTYYNGI